MVEEFDIVSGEFEGNFFTHQKNVLTASEWNSAEKNHAIHLYRGELKNINKEIEYKPENYRNRESLLLHNVTNVQFHSKSISGENTSKIFDFEQLLIMDAEIKESWELNGKTYGIIRGTIIGKVRQLNSNFDARNPPPQNTSDFTKYTPDESNFKLPPQRQVTDIVRDGGGVLKGCFSNIWRFLLALMFLLFLLWMLRGCKDNNNVLNDCCAERDQLLIEYEELKKEKDSLEIKLSEMNDTIVDNGGIDDEDLQDEINQLSSRVYFKGNSDEILKYSDKQIDKIVQLISKSGNHEIEVRGFYNGNGGIVENLDFKRASRVKELLINKGIDPNVISAIGKGQSFIDDEDDLDDIVIEGETVKWNRNMRVEIKIIKY